MPELIDSANKLFKQSFLNLSLIPHSTRWWAHSLFLLVVLVGYICTESAKPAFAQDGSSSVQCQTEYSKECFSQQEEWAWEQIVQGKPAEMNRFSKDSKLNCSFLNAREPIKQSSRTLSHKFIEFVATHKRYTQDANTRMVHIECAIVDGQINLSNKKIRPQLTIRNSLMKNGIDIHDAHFSRSFTIEKSLVTGTVNSAGALFDRGLSLKENRHEQVILDNAQIRANLRVEDSTLTKTFSARAIDVGGDIDFTSTAFEGPVNLIGAKTAGILFAEDSQFTREFIVFNLDAAGSILLSNTTFKETVDLTSAKTVGVLFADNSQFEGVFRAYDLVAGNIFLRNTTFKETVDLTSAKTVGELSAINSQFEGKFMAYDLVAGNIFLRNTTFKETVYLTGAKTAGILYAKNSQFKGEFIAHNLDAVGNMLLDNVSFGKQIGMVDAKIGKQLEIKDSVFKKEFIATFIEAGARILLTDTTFKETVYLVGTKTAGVLLANDSFEKQVYLKNAKIGKQLEIKDSVFENEFEAENIEASGDILLTDTIFKETVNLIGTKTGGQLNIKQAEFKKDLTAYGMQAGDNISFTETHFGRQVNLSLAKLGGTLNLVSSRFANKLDLRQTHIASDFILYDAKAANEGDVKKSIPLWKKEAKLMLNQAHAGALHASTKSWLIYDDDNQPTSTLLTRDLHGFTYDSLHLPEGSDIDDEGIARLIEWAGGTTTAMTATTETETLWGDLWDYLAGKQCRALEWQTGKTNYTPQPYTELAEKLREMGAVDQADQVLIARHNHHHAKQYSEGKFWPFIIGKIDCFVLSYRVEPFRPLYLFFLLIVLGAPFNFFAYKSVLRDYLLRKLYTLRNFFADKSSYKKLWRSLVRLPHYGFRFFADKSSYKKLWRSLVRLPHYGFRFLVCLVYLFYKYVLCPFFHSFGNSIPIPGFLSYTEARPDRFIYLLYTQKIIGLILLIFAGYIAI